MTVGELDLFAAAGKAALSAVPGQPVDGAAALVFEAICDDEGGLQIIIKRGAGQFDGI